MTGYKKLSTKSTVTARLFALILEMSGEEQKALLKELEDKRIKGKRKHVRRPLFMLVDYASQKGVYKDFTQNISESGVFIETRMPFRVGEDVTLTFPLPSRNEHLKIAGEVVRTDPEGIGVKFKLSDPDQQTMIEVLLKTI